MRENYILALVNLNNGALLGYEDKSSVPEYTKTIEDYVENLEQENKQLKDAIEQLEKYLNEKIFRYNPELYIYNAIDIEKFETYLNVLDKLKELKGVEDE